MREKLLKILDDVWEDNTSYDDAITAIEKIFAEEMPTGDEIEEGVLRNASVDKEDSFRSGIYWAINFKRK